MFSWLANIWAQRSTAQSVLNQAQLVAIALGPVRLLLLGLGCALLSTVGGMVWPTVHWSWIALPCGVTLATALSRGPWISWAGGVGVLLAMVVGGHTGQLPWIAGLSVIAVAVGACSMLRRTPFDLSLDRPHDIGWLVLASTSFCLPVALFVASRAVSGAEPDALWVWLGAWVVLSLGTLLGAVVVLTLGRQLPAHHRGQGQTLWLAVGVGALALLSFWAALAGNQTVRTTITFVVPWLIAGIALMGHLGVASLTMLALSLLAAGLADQGRWPWGSAGASRVGLAAWLSITLVAMLAAHTATAYWLRRIQRWEWALDGSRLGVADWSLRQSDDRFASAAWQALTGTANKPWDVQTWLSQVHPDDAAALARAIDELASGQVGSNRLELRIARSNTWRWFNATLLVAERDQQERPTRLLATLADIQEWHETQERQLMSLNLFRNLHEGVLVSDAELRALDVNPAYTHILGVQRDDVIGTVPSLLSPDPQDRKDPVARRQRAALWAGLRDHGQWRGELSERRTDGQVRTLLTTVSAVRGPHQDLLYHVVVIADVTDQQAQRQQLERQAHTDELTRLPNRARLSRLLEQAMRAADEHGHLLVVCYLDLDHFKPVNDRYGHATGDKLLVELAGRLRNALRSRNSATDVAARLGGDEFVMLLRVDTMEEARLAVERVLRVVAQPYFIEEDESHVQVYASLGATVYPVDRSDPDTLLRHADHAMYGAKQAGRNGYLFFDPELRRRTEARVSALGRVQEALDQHEFLLYYQPKVDLRSARVLGFEALLRWDHPEQGVVSPLQFLPLVEHTPLSARVGDWVLEQALSHLAQWRMAGLDISVSVNITARHLQEPHFALRLSELLAVHEDEQLAQHLELEMLESAAHADVESTSDLLKRCREMGVRFALDDFGTGYSTLTYLKRLPVEVLKIDRSFVHHMMDDAQDRAIVEGVIGLAHTFGCTPVAEGVETAQQAQALLTMGCHIGQGLGIAAPMPADAVANWVRAFRGAFVQPLPTDARAGVSVDTPVDATANTPTHALVDPTGATAGANTAAAALR